MTKNSLNTDFSESQLLEKEGSTRAETLLDGQNLLKRVPLPIPGGTPPGFRIKEKNVEYIGKDEKWHTLCSYVAPVACMRDNDNCNWSTIFELIDRDGVKHEVIVDSENSDCDSLFKLMRKYGVTVSASNKLHLQTYLIDANPKTRRRLVTKIGWHGTSYILPHKTYHLSVPALEDTSEVDEDIRLYVEGKTPEFKQKGTLCEWKNHIGRFAAGNSRMQVGIMTALGSPTLTLLNKENFGLHLLGSSSIGKSTSLCVACSVYGSEFRTWRTTDNAAESWGQSSNDNLLVLDDMGQASSNTIAQMAYMLGNGQGKNRANRKGVARDVAKFKICSLSTGEIGVEAKLKENREKSTYYAGQSVRLIEISADAGQGYGAFENLHGFSDGSALSKHLMQASKKYCGNIGDEWLKYLCDNREKLQDIITQHEKIFLKLVALPKEADGQVQRVHGHFALMASCGEICISEKLLPWDPGEANQACAIIFNDWMKKRGGLKSHEEKQLIGRVIKLLQQDGNSRFEIIDKLPIGTLQEDENDLTNPNRTVYNRAGYRTIKDSKWEYYVYPTIYKKEILEEMNEKKAGKILIDHGFLTPNGDGRNLSRNKRIKGEGNQRMYFMHLPQKSGEK